MEKDTNLAVEGTHFLSRVSMSVDKLCSHLTLTLRLGLWDISLILCQAVLVLGCSSTVTLSGRRGFLAGGRVVLFFSLSALAAVASNAK